MRRALIVLTVAVVGAGGALAYVGTRDHKAARVEEHLPTVPTLAGDNPLR
jgi:hypothetical protein